jgi:peptide/nickel transport system permease protein
MGGARWLDAAGCLGVAALLAWAAVAGFPRLPALLSPPAGFPLHAVIACLSWLAAAAGLGLGLRALARGGAPGGQEQRGQLADLTRQFRRNRAGLVGLYTVAWLVLLALLTPLIAPFDPDTLDVGPHRIAPTVGYLMGTDNFGRDLFSRVLFGARISLSIGFIAVAISATIGTAVGTAAGYFGGWIDGALMWLVDLLLSLPRLVLLLAIVGFFRASGAQSLFLIVAILGLTGWMGVSRIVRSTVLSLKEQDFIQACRALGLPTWRIMLLHLVPNTLAPVIVYASLAIGSTILVEAALSFLGLGVPPPTATWGAIVNDGREYMRSAPWITIFPGLMIVAAVMSFNLLGDGLRDALDPRLRGRG